MAFNIFFATNRNETGENAFGTRIAPDNSLRFGRASIPDDLFGPWEPKGNLGSIQVSTYAEAPGGAYQYGSQQCFAEITAECQQRNGRDVLIYLHGYNTDFRDALYYAADLGRSLVAQRASCPGTVPAADPVIMVFTWPSDGKLLRYPSDREDAMLSAPAMRRFMEILRDARWGRSDYADFGLRGLKVHLLCQSMGNLVLMRGLQALIETDRPLEAVFDQVMLGAADVPRDAFNDDDKLIPLKHICRQVTVYHNPWDTVIMMGSTPVNWSQRLGCLGPKANADMEMVAAVDCLEPAERGKNPYDDLSRHYYTRTAPEVQRDILQVMAETPPGSVVGREPKPGVSRYRLP